MNAHDAGMLVGQIFAMVVTSATIAAIWYHHTKTTEIAKLVAFVLVGFMAASVLGLLAGIPMMFLANHYAKSHALPAELKSAQPDRKISA